MRTIKKNVYQFKELSKEAERKALESLRTINVSDGFEWYEGVIEGQKTELEMAGYDNADINFSGFGSQGDGANFTAEVHLKKIKIGGLKIEERYGISAIKITKSNSRYEHEMIMQCDIELLGTDYTFKISEIENIIQEDARGRARQIYRELEQCYDFLTTDASVQNTIEINDWEFYEDGTQFND